LLSRARRALFRRFSRTVDSGVTRLAPTKEYFMRSLTRTTIILVFTFATAAIGCAQTPPPSAPAPSSSSKDSEPPPPPPPAKPVRIVGKAEVYHFSKINQTRATVHFYVVGKFHDMYEKKDVLEMEAAYEVVGDKAIKPESVYFILSSSSSNGLKYKDDHKLTIYLDGAEFRSAETREWFSHNDPGRISSETYVAPRLRYADFLRLLDAKKVEMKFGQTRFTLSRDHVEALRDLSRTVEQ
jgi:hypothetical protein